jgi:hypothetical protein
MGVATNRRMSTRFDELMDEGDADGDDASDASGS